MFRVKAEPQRRKRSRGTSPEEVLLQVSLAFTIILGFLLSDENTFNVALSKRLDRVAVAYGDLMALGMDGVMDKANQANALAGRMKLLNAWLEIRGAHRLFQQVQRFGDPSGPIKYMSSAELLADGDFLYMRDRVDGLFGSAASSAEPTEALAEEIARSIALSVAKAGQKMPDWADEVPLWLRDPKAREAMKLLDGLGRAEEGIASTKNLRFLAEEIHSDFLALRNRAGRVQLKAVSKIAQGRILRAIAPGVSSDAAQSLSDLLDELDEQLKLLPEVRNQLESIR